MSKLQVTIGQRVALFNHRHSFQQWYIVESISPKGTKIVVHNENYPEHKRTFSDKNVERVAYKSSYSGYLRTDVDVVSKQIERDDVGRKISTLISNNHLGVNYNCIYYTMDKQDLIEYVNNVQNNLNSVRELIHSIPD